MVQEKEPDVEANISDSQLQKAHNNVEMGSTTFINCDLRFFNLQYLVDQLGHFEVVQIDPPWRIKGA